MTMLVARLVAALGIICGAVAWSACDRCAFRILDRLTFDSTVDCCGSSARREVTIPEGTDRQVDLANTRFPTVAGTVDVWLAPADCEKLFDGTYPGASALCRTYIGPVAPGAVSARIKLDGGRYRVFAQSHSSNAEPARYVADVGIWGKDCTSASPTRP
jgi:hypothetical protein